MTALALFDTFYRRRPITSSYSNRMRELQNALNRAECIVVGAGAGLSAAAGLEYSGKRFTDNFQDFISRYGFTDLYTSSFYKFRTEEERWAYWARHIRLNRFDDETGTNLYHTLLQTIGDKEYFVITTNVDGQFEKAGFDRRRIFAPQGDYAYIQCSKACHRHIYPDEALVDEMSRNITDCRIPASLVPRCPECGAPMDVNIRKDENFVQDAHWYESHERYRNFMQKACRRNTLLLELGVGYNTPAIIRFPFERMASQADNITLVRINRDYAEKQASVPSFIPFREDMNKIITDILK
ncbi:Sir2 family NAD-dependent protein deacetylase [Alistipes putredinis]|uniref:Sir2 family NAD-dependent protein deacetylase n=2 Tax=Alistipes TaxID=239759 RepID=UPI003AAC0D5F